MLSDVRKVIVRAKIRDLNSLRESLPLILKVVAVENAKPFYGDIVRVAKDSVRAHAKL